MKIIKYKRISKGRYKITFDTNEIILYEDVILKNNLLLTNDVTIELLEKVIEENKYYEVYDLSLSYIEIKMRTSKELIEYLKKKGFEKKYIDKCIERLKQEGYLNEERYIEAYINDKLNLTSWGPYKIRRNLLELDLNETLIDTYIEKIPYEEWKDKLNKIISKKLLNLKNKSLYMIKNKLKIDLFNLGYQTELIEELLSNLEKNDNDILEKEYKKAYNKYSKKYDDKKLYVEIKNYLYRKGFNIDEINEIISKNSEF